MSAIFSDIPEPEVVDFGPPFDDEDADLILRSSDNIDFRVYRVVISKSSAALKEKIRNAERGTSDKAKGTPNGDRGSLPVVAMPANSDTLHSLLSTILPVPIYIPESLEGAAPVLSLAVKHEMNTSVDLIQKFILADSLGVVQTMDPYQAYFLACRYDLSKVAILAASRTVSQPMTVENCVSESLRFVSASALNALWSFHSQSTSVTWWGPWRSIPRRSANDVIAPCFAETVKPVVIPRAHGPPFDRSDADIILRSSDGVDFSIHKAILAMASPVFEGMFTLPRPTDYDEGPNNVPILDVSESSKTLSILLSTILPVPAPAFSRTNIEEIFPALAAAEKYEMTCASSWIRVLLRQHGDPVTLMNAFRAYGIASQCRLRNEGGTAAHLTLRLPMTFKYMTKDLHTISGAALCALWQYRKACFQSAQSCFQDACKPSTSLNTSLQSVCELGICIGLDPETKLPLWWNQFFENYVARFSDATQPLPQMNGLELEGAFRGAIPNGHANECGACKNMITLVCSILTNELKMAVENVSIDFDAW
ncbi:hypothetical protein OF83DRAFT_1175806 [Amylostereum chailletii]|nr:hypothetical protein OF83DRAFT_1175806 [Amylostereum chailletii]